MQYDAFTGDITIADFADILLSELSDEFGVISDINAATQAIEGFISEVQGDETSWGDLATHAADLASVIIDYVPVSRAVDLAAFIYDQGSLL